MGGPPGSGLGSILHDQRIYSCRCRSCCLGLPFALGDFGCCFACGESGGCGGSRLGNAQTWLLMNCRIAFLSLVLASGTALFADPTPPASFVLVDYTGADGDPAGIWPVIWVKGVNHGDKQVDIRINTATSWTLQTNTPHNNSSTGGLAHLYGQAGISPGQSYTQKLEELGYVDLTRVTVAWRADAVVGIAGLHETVDGGHVEYNWEATAPHFYEGNMMMQVDVYYDVVNDLPTNVRVDCKWVDFQTTEEGNVGNSGNGNSQTGTTNSPSGATITNYVSHVQGGTNGVSVGTQTIDVNVTVDLGGYSANMDGSAADYGEPGDLQGSVEGLGGALDSAMRIDISSQIPKLSGLSGISFGSASSFTLPGGRYLGDIQIDLAPMETAINIFRVIVLFGSVIMFTFAAQSIIRKGVA